MAVRACYATTIELLLSDSIAALPGNDIVILITIGKGERIAENEIQ